MKKICLVLTLVLLLCSCSSKREITPCLAGISFTAEIVYYNESYSLDGTISKSGELTAKMKEPEELSDLKIMISESGTVVDYKGLTYTPLEGTMPFAKVISELYKPIFETIKNETAVTSSDGILKGENFTFKLSPTGLPLELMIPDERFQVKFYNVTICEDVND